MRILINSHICFLMTVLLLSLLTPAPAAAQLRPGGERDSSGPISISSDFLEADDLNGLATFSGQVVARQGTMTITSDVMKIFYFKTDSAGGGGPPGKDDASPAVVSGPAAPAEETSRATAAAPGATRLGGGSQIERVECEGNVKIVDGDRLAIGRKAVYLVQSQPRRIVLTGEARLWQGRDSLTGHQVTYYLDAGRSTVESREEGRLRERIQTIYHPEEQPK
ncbi:MAG: hypothetical protein LBS31_03250 [Candidatus Adiutrix sp.]|jgi:lipopolysaccharide export system protein LptA|nr:hypothetical protein [Candidatus Adiutrix sp.]